MSENPNMIAYDALRLAVDLHKGEGGSGAVYQRQQEVLADAEAFYEWLRSKQGQMEGE